MKNLVLGMLLLASPFYGNAEQENDFVPLFEQLSNAPGASGFEGPIREILQKEWKPLLSDLKIDGMGNLIGALKNNQEGPRVLLLAHMDEVGFIVREVTKDGFLRINPAGSWLDPVLLSQKWIVMTPNGPIKGVTGGESVHIASPSAIKAVSSQDLFIDIGVKSDKEAFSLGIRPGLPVTPETEFTALNETGRYLGKAFDDRVALVVITEVLKKVIQEQLPNSIIVAATTQEEVGMRGAEVVYPSTLPDIVINIDIGLARDFPPLFNFRPLPVALGQGPACFVLDREMIPNNKLVEFVIATAKQKGIPLQYDVGDDYGQDGCRLQVSGKGIPVVNLGIPVRYPHSHIGVVDRKDIDATILLITELLRSLNSEEVAKIKSF